jgi:hypothetical protein
LSVYGLGRARIETQLEPETRTQLDARELWVKWEAEHYSIALGRRQVVWGKTDGFQLLDIIHPLDLHDFLLDEYADMRIPLWMLEAELFFCENSAVQLLFIPDVRFNDLASPQGIWYLGPEPPTQAFEIVPPDRPTLWPKDWQYGVRWSGQIAGATFALHGLYGWNREPAGAILLDATGALVWDQQFDRERLLGVAGDVPIDDWLFRLEATYSPDVLQPVVAPDGTVDFVDFDSIKWALGVDRLLAGWFLSAQFFQQALLEMPDGTIGHRFRDFATALVTRRFVDDRLGTRWFSAFGFEDIEYWISSEISYRFFDQLELGLRADFFGGAQPGLLGQFAANDRILLRAEYIIGNR